MYQACNQHWSLKYAIIISSLKPQGCSVACWPTPLYSLCKFSLLSVPSTRQLYPLAQLGQVLPWLYSPLKLGSCARESRLWTAAIVHGSGDRISRLKHTSCDRRSPMKVEL